MILAIRKDTSGTVPGGGYHYFLHPIAMESKEQGQIFEMMGYITIEVEEEKGLRLVDESKKALLHQYEIAVLAERKP